MPNRRENATTPPRIARAQLRCGSRPAETDSLISDTSSWDWSALTPAEEWQLTPPYQYHNWQMRELWVSLDFPEVVSLVLAEKEYVVTEGALAELWRHAQSMHFATGLDRDDLARHVVADGPLYPSPAPSSLSTTAESKDHGLEAIPR